ncbi:hypothetical protein [Luteibacter aegosomatissinici]|uniref:hypothetical protein n=1 Tax=Luteibacter aegosomatissinici TaxID=2911539 RepID=UPI001FFA9645|nr:hypothetical protein [Luteibacter aegosomatissinici]UPG92809.1 hypothetical protein L2Y97_13135 [Luteibacter aegosomatissinici]
MNPLLFRALCALAACLVAGSALAGTTNELLDRLQSAARSPAASDREKASHLTTLYDQHGRPTPSSASALPDKDLRAWFLAAFYVIYYSDSPSHLGDLYLIRNVLVAHQADVRVETDYLFRALVMLRRFDEAKRLSTSSPGAFESIPDVAWLPGARAADTPILVPDPNGRRLEVRPFRLRDDFTVLVVSHPLCHFSRNASRDITADGQLSHRLAGHIIWIEPPGQKLDMTATADWQRELGDQPVVLMNSQGEWPLLDSFDTPTFYVFRGKTLVGHKAGWAGPGDRAALSALLDRAAGGQASEQLATSLASGRLFEEQGCCKDQGWPHSASMTSANAGTIW